MAHSQCVWPGWPCNTHRAPELPSMCHLHPCQWHRQGYTDTGGRCGSKTGGWSVRQYCRGGCGVLGVLQRAWVWKGSHCSCKKQGEQGSAHQPCRSSGSVPIPQPACPGPSAHRHPAPTGLCLTSSSVGLSPFRRKLETHLFVSQSCLYHLHLPPRPSCLHCPPPALLRGGRHSFPSCESSSLAISLLCQVITNLRGEPRALPVLLSIFTACCYLLLCGIWRKNAACPRERAAAARTQQAKFSSWLCQGSPL